MKPIFSILLSLVLRFSVLGAVTTVPEASAVYSSFPFHGAIFPTNGARYQEVFSASAFAGLPPEGVRITGLGFYADKAYTMADFTLAINLSTTVRTPDGLSTTFAANVGPDDTKVFESLTPVFLDTMTDGQGRQVFEFGLQTPFVYRPQAGSLLMDIRNYNYFSRGRNYANVDAAGDVVSRVFVDNVNSAIGNTRTDGLQVRFTYEAVPEPHTVALFILGAAVFSALRITKRRRTSGKEPDFENP